MQWKTTPRGAQVREALALVRARLKVGDRVSWNSEAGRVSGHVIRVHTRDIDYKGYNHHASTDDPQYEIHRDKTDHIAMHRDTALRKHRH